MYFIYRKNFDLSRTRSSNSPRLANVNLSTFGQWATASECGDAEYPGCTVTDNLNEGLQDLLAYGFEELRKVEFVDILDGEVANFQRGIAGEIRQLCERFTSAEVAAQNANDHARSVAVELATKFGLTITETNIPSSVLASPSDFREVCYQFVRMAAFSQRRSVSRELIENSSVQLTRPLIGGATLSSHREFRSTPIVVTQQSVSLLQLDDGPHYTMAVPQITVDDTPLARRYTRYLQYLAHAYTPLRLRITVDTRTNLLFVQVLIDYQHNIEEYYELYRPEMPDCTLENPTVNQKIILIFAAISRLGIDMSSPVTVPDSLFAEPTQAQLVSVIGGRMVETLSISHVNPSAALAPAVKSVLEAAWSLSKLRESTLQSTSLNFQELMLYTQPSSPEPSTV